MTGAFKGHDGDFKTQGEDAGMSADGQWLGAEMDSAPVGTSITSNMVFSSVVRFWQLEVFPALNPVKQNLYEIFFVSIFLHNFCVISVKIDYAM